MKIILNLLFLGIVFISTTFSQGEIAKSELIKSFSRTRLMYGYVKNISKDNWPYISNYFVNLNHKTSKFDKFSKTFQINSTLEYGMNTIYGRNIGLMEFALIPYIKAGPEMNFTNNLYVEANFGLAFIIFGYFTISPTIGFNSNYLIPLGDVLILDLEFGYNTSIIMLKKNTPHLFYLTAGIGVR